MLLSVKEKLDNIGKRYLKNVQTFCLSYKENKKIKNGYEMI